VLSNDHPKTALQHSPEWNPEWSHRQNQMAGGFPCPWWPKQGNGLTRVESRLLWQLFSCHSLGWEFCSLNSIWQHPTENYILALSGRVLNLPRCPGINLTWLVGTAGVWTQQNSFNEMVASAQVSLESSLRDPRGTPGGPLTLARQEGHSPHGWPQPPCEGARWHESCLSLCIWSGQGKVKWASTVVWGDEMKTREEC